MVKVRVAFIIMRPGCCPRQAYYDILRVDVVVGQAQRVQELDGRLDAAQEGLLVQPRKLRRKLLRVAREGLVQGLEHDARDAPAPHPAAQVPDPYGCGVLESFSMTKISLRNSSLVVVSARETASPARPPLFDLKRSFAVVIRYQLGRLMKTPSLPSAPGARVMLPSAGTSG